VEAAGFENVRISTLDEVERAERINQPDRQRSASRYVLSAWRP
jgi:hypothetical protein